MKHWYSFRGLLTLTLFILVISISTTWGQRTDAPQRDRSSSSISSAARAHAGVRFTENRGQVVDDRGGRRPDILYTAGGGAMRVYLRRDGVSYVFNSWIPDSPPVDGGDLLATARRGPERLERSGVEKSYRMDMQLLGANPRAEILAEDPTGSWENYYLPHCSEGVVDVESYRRVIYRDIYPNIDLVFHGNEDGLKYDFVVRPGGRVSDIRWRYVGAENVTMAKGRIHLRTPLGDLDEAPPSTYQEGRGEVACRYRIDAGTFSFEAGQYEGSLPLVIDPTVSWATYIGGDSAEIAPTPIFWSEGITVDPNGDIVVCGSTNSATFPVTPGAMQSSKGAVRDDFFITKISSAGALLWSTYWGGTIADIATAVGRDPSGNYILCGYSWDSTFPVSVGAYKGTISGDNDLIFAKLDPGGHRVWATYFGGNGLDYVYDVAVDRSGDFVAVGESNSSDFPAINAFQGTFGFGNRDGIIVKFSGAGTPLWSTYYGGSLLDHLSGVAIDSSGNVIACGATASANLTMFGTSLKGTFAGRPDDGCLIKLASDGTPLWSTFYGGGNALTWCQDVAVDPAGTIYMVGTTTSRALPTTAASFQPAYKGDPKGDAFVAKFDGAGGHLWSTYYGGSGQDVAGDVVVAWHGDLFITGITASADFPQTNDSYQFVLNGASDAFFLQLGADGAQMWATYYGGKGDDEGARLTALLNDAYITGVTTSTDLPAAAFGFDRTYNGGGDRYVAKFTGLCARPMITPSGPTDLCDGDSVTLTARDGFTSYQWAPGNQTSRSIVVKKTGTYVVNATDALGCSSSARPVLVRVFKKPTPAIASAGIVFCDGDSLLLSAKQPAYLKYRWSTGDTTDQIWAKAAGPYTVTVIDTNGCEGTSSTVILRTNARPTAPVLSPLDTIWVCPDSTYRLDAGAGYTSYKWSPNGEATRTVSIKGAGIYYVTVTNALGCRSRSDTVVVMQYPRVPVSIQIEGSKEFCAGDSVVLRVPPGAFTNPRWSRRDTTDAITVKSSGLYYVTVTDSNGCRMRSDTVRVTVHPALNATITGPSTVCRNTTPTYGASAFGTLRYEWSVTGEGTIQGPSDGKSITVQWGVSGGGTVLLRITDTVTGCVVTGVRDVTIGSELKPVIAPASITLCEGDSVELDAGSGYSTYAWSNGATSQTIWVKDTLGYSVEVVDPTGCRGRSDTVHARLEKKPAVVIDGAVKVCCSTTVTYTSRDNTGASYQWTVSGGSITAGDSTSSMTVQWGTGSNGVITLRMTSASGCTGETTMSVEIGSELKPSIAASGPLNLCAPDSVELDAGAGYTSYLWSPGGETSQKITVSAAGNYSVTVQDASGCGGTSDPVQVTINQRPSVAITPGGPLKLKLNDSIMLDAGAGHAGYRWSTGATTQRITARDTGIYSVTVTDANGCSATATVRIDIDQTSGSAELALGDVTATPGERVEIPLRLVASRDLAAAGASGYTARIRYRASMLEPAGTTPRGALDGDDRVLSVSGDLPAGMTSGDLARLAFIAAMGDSEVVALKLENVLWRDATNAPLAIATTLGDGSLTLAGLCTNGGVRLVSSGGAVALRVVRSNPVRDLLEVEYELIERGHHELSLHDILGREVATLMVEEKEPGRGEASYQTTSLPDGLYLLVLRTPTARVSIPVRVVR